MKTMHGARGSALLFGAAYGRPVLAKFALTTPARTIPLLCKRQISFLEQVASHGVLAAGDLRSLRLQVLADAAAAILVLLLVTGLSV